MSYECEKTKKVMVLGLDGVPCSLLKEYTTRGIMPELSRLLERGFGLHSMNASIPDVSSTSWTSFMTGVNPGEHGIYGFTDLAPHSYRMVFPDSGFVKAPPVWDMIGRTAGERTSTLYERFRGKLTSPKKSIVLNLPQTYPARPLNGMLTAGFVCPDLRKGTCPERLFNYLDSIGYMPDIDATKATDEPDEFFRDIFRALEKREAAFTRLMDNEPWDLFIAVVTETDRLHHFFFDAAYDPGHKRNKVFLSFYRRLDEIIGVLFNRFMEHTDGNGLFLTLSDHGFAPIKEEVYLNTWFREKGWLRLAGNGDYFERVDGGTRLFSMDPARIFINLEGRFPRGSVKPEEREGVMEEAMGALESLKSPAGEPVIKDIFPGRDIYSGPEAGRAPDLVCLPHDGFDLKGMLKKPDAFGRGPFTGMHTRHDAHLTAPLWLKVPETPHVEDPASWILEYLAG